MAWSVADPEATDKLAVSQADLLANMVALEGVLGSGTLAAGLTIVQGNILYGSAGDTLSVLAPGTSGYYLQAKGAAADPVWAALPVTGNVKGWVNIDGTGTAAVSDSLNVDSITDNDVGDFTITWDTDFANTDYAVAGMAINDNPTNAVTVCIKDGVDLTVGATNILVANQGGTAVDRDPITVIAIGDQ